MPLTKKMNDVGCSESEIALGFPVTRVGEILDSDIGEGIRGLSAVLTAPYRNQNSTIPDGETWRASTTPLPTPVGENLSFCALILFAVPKR